MEQQNETKKLSRAAIEEYQGRLEELKTVKRLEVAEQIKEARAFGDISENAEYDSAMDNQARIEYEIVQLEELLANVEEIDESSIDTSVVSVGGRIRLKRLADNTEEVLDIVSTNEIEPFARRVTLECSESAYNKRLGFKAGQKVELEYPVKLSNESPVGRAIIGRSSGDTVEVVAPGGVMQYEVLEIDRIPDLPQGKIIAEEIL